jgi:hypothetical protein
LGNAVFPTLFAEKPPQVTHAGDNLVVSELSRLGRSMLECMEILSIAFQM